MKRSIASALLLVSSVIAASVPQSVPNRAPLQPTAFNLLPLTSVKPTGWLLEQLRIQSRGLSGHLDEFWPDLSSSSGWLGGSGEGWERGPYFLDGLVPLAYLTGDATLIAKVKKWMDWTLDHQQPDGWIGPTNQQNPRQAYDWWPNYVMLKAMAQYQEATGDPRVIPVMEKYFAYQAKTLEQRPLKQWAIYRWQDEMLTLFWLYNRNGDSTLLDLARKLHAQGHDWEAQFAQFRFHDKVEKKDANLATHGVNNAMALKSAAVWWQLTGERGDRDALYRMFEMLDRYHGQPSGIFASDEHYAGRDPSQGTELCTVVEAMFSLEIDMSILGDAVLGDRLEKIAYNALPGTLTADMWAHQYDQQANQISCTLANRRWSTNGPQANIFGLEPNFGCCTANMHQGWPKLAAHLWMAVPGGGLAAIAYGPSTVTTLVAGDTSVLIEERTDYPFRDLIQLTVKPERAVSFPLMLRIPAWAGAASVSVNGESQSGVRAATFFSLNRQWRPDDRVEIRFPMLPRATTWYNNSLAIERGPLVYSLKIGEIWHELKSFGPSKDWEVFPSSPWNYALALEKDNPAASIKIREKPLGVQPFSSEGAPVELTVKARRLPSWQIVDDSAGPLPVSPVTTRQAEETIALIPYGAAKLRITAFPYIAPTTQPQDRP
jgi:uncharacterized protein